MNVIQNHLDLLSKREMQIRYYHSAIMSSIKVFDKRKKVKKLCARLSKLHRIKGVFLKSKAYHLKTLNALYLSEFQVETTLLKRRQLAMKGN